MSSYRVFFFSVIFVVVSQFSVVELTFWSAPGLWDIKIKDAKFIPASPLFFHGGLAEKWLVNQTGQSVEVLVDQPLTVGSVTGGLLYNSKYRFSKFRYYWNDNATIAKGHEDIRLEVVVYYYNEKYGSFENSLNYHDGLVAVSSRVNVGWVPNLVFAPFQKVFKKFIKKPGDSVSILSALTYLWFSNYPLNTNYHVYPGAYYDEKTGKTHYCTKYIALQLVPFNFISNKQYKETFGSLEDCSKHLLNNVPPQEVGDSLLVESSQGFILKNIPA